MNALLRDLETSSVGIAINAPVAYAAPDGSFYVSLTSS